MPKSKSDVHLTPNEVYDFIDDEWCVKNVKSRLMFDPCPINPNFDGLTISWQDWNYVNPPYGDGKKDEGGNTLLARFVYKALTEYRHGHSSIMLLPSKTDQEWFHSIKNYPIHWFNHRLKFKNNKWSATQPHFLVKLS